MALPSWDAEKMLDIYVYDYLIKRKCHKTAQAFVAEKLVSPVPVAIDASGGFLLEWWLLFWDIFIARSRTPSDNAASTMQGQVHDRFGLTSQNQQQMQASHLSNLLQLPHESELQAGRATSRLHGMTPGLNANLLLKQKQLLQQSVLSQYAKNADYIQQQGRVSASGGGPRVDCGMPNDLVGSNHNFQSVSSTNFQRASNNVGQKRKGSSPASDPFVERYLGYSRAQPALHFPTTARSAVDYSPALHQSNGYYNTNYSSANSELCLPTTLPIQTNVVMTSSLTHSEGLVCPTSATTVGKDRIWNDNGVVQVESLLSRTNVDVGERFIQLDVGGKGYTFSETHHLIGNIDKVECCQFSFNGKLLASGGSDNKVTLWCTESFTIKSKLGEHAQAITDLRFSTHMPWLASSSVDGTIRVWDANNPVQSIRTFTGHSAAVSSVDFHPQKDDFICSCDDGKEIRYWTMKSGRCAGMIKGGATFLRFQPCSGRFLSTAGKNVVSLYEVETQICRQRIQDHKSTVHALCWDSSGDHLASVSDDLVSVWRVGSGNNMECVYQLNCSRNKFRSCVFHPALPSVLIIGCYKSLELWNMAENKRVTLDAHQDLISSLSASSSNGYIASASHDKSIKIWM